MTEMETLLADIEAGRVSSMSAEEQDSLVQRAKDDVGAPFEDAVADRLVIMRQQNPADYMRLRERLKSVKVGVTELERVLDSRMGKAGNFEDTSPGQGRVLSFMTVERWEQNVDGQALVTELVEMIERYVCLPREAAVATALWIIASYCYDTFQISARLVITSPQKRCGKSTLLGVVSKLVSRPLLASNITAAAMFRTIEKYHPTLLIDEADTFLPENEELRGVINSGHSYDGAVIRLVGDNHDPVSFSTFGAMAIAAIGDVPGTIADRAIKIALRRRLPHEAILRLRDALPEVFEVLKRKIVRFLSDAISELEHANPSMPSDLNDRQCDNWVGLLAIADIIEGDWPKIARETAVKLSVQDSENESKPYSIMLLEDIQRIRVHSAEKSISSTELAAALIAFADRPWATCCRGRELTAAWVAKTLRPYGISPKTIKTKAGKQPNGYDWSQFIDAVRRYLSDEPDTPPEASPSSPRSPDARTEDETGLLPDAVDEDDWMTPIPKHIIDRFASKPSNL